ncbi:MAG: MmgE/PrpD family protein, partial [Burkholderiales bacterium]|nr:MmgE/PrpD family protein [Burkholderiales bacterium]
TSAHALDYDDVALGGHPSTVLVPAVLAAAEAADASGARAIEAYLVGYETWAELASREPDPYHEKGWHPTAVLGTVAAAAAVCRLRGLPADASLRALGVAASMASGLVANFGSMTKPLHAGRAAACAIDAVDLASDGLTSSADALGSATGYLAALSPRGRAERGPPVMRLGSRLRIREAGLSVKRYPVCYSSHRAIDGVLAIVAAHRIVEGEIREIRVTIGPTAAAMLHNHAPATALEARFSLEFAVACAAVAGNVGLRELDDARVADPRVRRLMAAVRIDIADTRCPIEPVFAYTDRVVVTLRDGRELDSGEIRFPRGNARLPMSDEELAVKFTDCATGIDRGLADRLLDSLGRLEALPSVRTLPMPAAAVR